MDALEYVAPKSVEEAVACLAEQGEGARPLAGGTDILVQLREGLKQARVIVDIKKAPELTALPETGNGEFVLGAAVPCERIYGHADICRSFPALVDAARIIGGWQIQSRASIGGNLCNSSPAADGVPPLLVHGVTCEIAGPGGRRQVPAAEFCTGVGKNVLQPGELLVSLRFPTTLGLCGSAYERFIPRNEMDIAVAGAASWVQLDDSGETITAARIALGAIAPTPVLAEEAAEWLVGQPAREESFEEAGQRARAVANPINDKRGTIDYRTHLAGVLTRRTLQRAVERARGHRS